MNRGGHLPGMEGHLQRCGEMQTYGFTETGEQGVNSGRPLFPEVSVL